MAKRYVFKTKARRVWAEHASPDAPGWDGPGGGDGDTACPRELSSHAVALREKKDDSRRRDRTREQNQRKIFWYIQYSRDWNWRKLAAAVDIQPEMPSSPVRSKDQDVDENEWIWYWRWLEYKRARRKQKRKGGVPAKFSSMVKWISGLNRDNSEGDEEQDEQEEQQEQQKQHKQQQVQGKSQTRH